MAHDLNVDGGGQPKVKDLRHHVDGEGVEGHAREALIEDAAQLLDVVVGGMVLFGERDLDVGVSGADRRGVGVGGVESAVGQADVVDDGDDLLLRDRLPYGVVDPVADGGHVFDAGSGAGAHVNLELATIDGREEVLAEEGIEHCSGDDGEDGKQNKKDNGVGQTGLKNAVIAAAEFLEVMLEAKLKADQRIVARHSSVVGFVVEFLQKVFGHGRHDGTRQYVGGEHGKADGLAERHEEIPGDAA